MSSGSARSLSTHRSESRLDESLSSVASFPNSPNGGAVNTGKAGGNGSAKTNGTIKSPR